MPQSPPQHRTGGHLATPQPTRLTTRSFRDDGGRFGRHHRRPLLRQPEPVLKLTVETLRPFLRPSHRLLHLRLTALDLMLRLLRRPFLDSITNQLRNPLRIPGLTEVEPVNRLREAQVGIYTRDHNPS